VIWIFIENISAQKHHVEMIRRPRKFVRHANAIQQENETITVTPGGDEYLTLH
jgi:hypothetical protein